MVVSTETTGARPYGATANSPIPSPRAPLSIRRAASLCSAAALAAAMWAGPAVAACEKRHVVRPGESLSLIARQHYGTAGAYPRLHRENLAIIGGNPDVIHAGMTLTVPCPNERPPRVQRPASAPDDGFARRSPASIQFSVSSAERSGVAPTASDAVVSAEALAGRLADGETLQIVDLAPRATLAQGAIDGALSIGIADWEALARRAEDPGRLASATGISLDAPVVLVPADQSFRGLDAAARVYWLLTSAGAEDVAVLDGARADWPEAGLPLSTTVRVPVGSFEAPETSSAAASPFGAAVPGATVVEASIEAAATDGEGMVTEPLAQLAVQTVGNFKSLDIPLGSAPVQITDDGEGVAALAWFLLSEVVRITDVHFAERSGALASDGLRIVGRAVVGGDAAVAGASPAVGSGSGNRPDARDLAVTRPSRREQDVSMELSADAGTTEAPALRVDRTSGGARPSSPPSLQILSITPLRSPKDDARIPPSLRR